MTRRLWICVVFNWGILLPGALQVASAAEEAPSAKLLAVDLVTTYDKAVPFPRRLRAADRLGITFHPGQADRIYDFLGRKDSDDPLPPEQLNALKNNVAEALLRLKPPPDDFGSRLIEMYEDGTQDIVWRDYCIQFLGSWYSMNRDSDERHRVAETLWDAANRNWSIAGTALLSLKRAGPGPGIDHDAVGRRACELALDTEANENARVTALQVAADLGADDALDIAVAVLDSKKKESAMLRVSALAALGTLGGEESIPVLQPFCRNPDIRLRSAANAAVKRIRLRGK